MHSPVVLGMDFGGSKIAVAASDADGARLGTATVAVRQDETARQTFERGVAAGRGLLDAVAPGRPLVAVGACTFGIPRENGVDLAPNISGWGDLPFGAELRRAFLGADIRMATDVKAAAQAEVEHGALAGQDPALYVNLGTGLAVAIVSGGAVLTGHHGAAGEIGYNLRRPDDAHDTLRLEEAVSGKALAAAAASLIVDGDVADLFERAETDERLARVCADFLAELAFHLVNLTIAIDPQRIAVGGGMVRSWDRLRPTIDDALRAAVPFPPDLVLADYPFDAPLIGALALGLAAARDVLADRDGTTDADIDVISEGAPA